MARMDRAEMEDLIANGLGDLEAVKFEDWENEEAGLSLVGQFSRGSA